MTTKERLHATIDELGEENLDELYRLAQDFAAKKLNASNPGIMTRLKSVKIDAPADFAANLDLYTSGKRRVEDHLP